MKYLYRLPFLILVLMSLIAFGQKSSIDPKNSTVHWLGEKVTGQHDGYISIKKGVIELKKNRIIAGEFTIDMNSITCTDIEDDTYNKKFVGHLKNDDFFGVNDFPEASFKLTSSSKFNKGVASLTGKITIKGKTEEISFKVFKSKNTYTAKIKIDRTKFGIKYGSASFFESLGDRAIYDEFTLDVKLVVK